MLKLEESHNSGANGGTGGALAGKRGLARRNRRRKVLLDQEPYENTAIDYSSGSGLIQDTKPSQGADIMDMFLDQTNPLNKTVHTALPTAFKEMKRKVSTQGALENLWHYFIILYNFG